MTVCGRPRTCGQRGGKKKKEKKAEKGRTERRVSDQTISHFMCGVVQPFHSSSLHHSLLLLLLLSPTAAHSPVFHHTYPHFNCNHPIYCYLYPPLLLSLLLLLLLLWLELLSSCAFFFCFISMVLNIGF